MSYCNMHRSGDINFVHTRDSFVHFTQGVFFPKYCPLCGQK